MNQTKPSATKFIPSARVRTILSNFINSEINKQIDLLKPTYKEYKKIKDPLDANAEKELDKEGNPVLDDKKQPKMIELTKERREELQKQLDANKNNFQQVERKYKALTEARTRFSDNVSDTLAVVIEETLKNLILSAMDKCVENGDSMIHMEYLHHEDIKNLNVYPLIKNLKSWQNPPTIEKHSGKKVKKEDNDDENSDDNRSFVNYIEKMTTELARPAVRDDEGNIVYEMKTVQSKKEGEEAKDKQIKCVVKNKSGKYSKVRCEGPIKNYLNTLMLELIERLSPLIHQQLTTKKIKTINKSVILDVVKFILLDGKEFEIEVRYSETTEPDPDFKPDPKNPNAKPPKIKVGVAEKVIKYKDNYYKELKSIIDTKVPDFENKKAERAPKKATKKSKPQANGVNHARKPAKVGA